MDKNPQSQLLLLLAWLIALSAMLISLYGSEILHQPVCPLCWYQRICLYSLAIILGIAAFRDDPLIAPYAITLACIGGAFALYHYLQQMVPGFHPIDFCSAANPTSKNNNFFIYQNFTQEPKINQFRMNTSILSSASNQSTNLNKI